jgi:hypothetical protein
MGVGIKEKDLKKLAPSKWSVVSKKERKRVRFSTGVDTQSSRNLDRKITLRRAKNTLVASVRGTISLEPKLDFPQVRNFKKESSASFPRTPRSPKSDIGSYVYRARESRRK